MYDLIIVGSGPAGLTAAIYARRGNLKVLLIEKNAPGGAIINTKTVENYPGYEKINGFDLAINMFSQVQKLKTEFTMDNIKRITKVDNIFNVIGNKTYEAKSVLIANGTTYNKLNLEGEDKYISHGISFCALCDGALYKEKDVAVVGGGSSALQEALYLASVVSKVYLIHRRNEFRGEEELAMKVKNTSNIELVLSSEVTKYIGNGKIEGVLVYNKETKEAKDIKVSAVFLYVGNHVDDEAFKDLKITNEKGYIITDENMETSVKNLYAAGDCREKDIRQIVTATSDGAIAASNIIKRLK